MAQAPEKPRAAGEPTVFQRYSPHGELPLASAASIAAHVLMLLAVVIIGIRVFGVDDEIDKPARMDLVEIEGEGGGLGGLAVGPGKLDSGPPGRTEGAPNAKGGGKLTAQEGKHSEYKAKLKDAPQFDNLKVPLSPSDGAIGDYGDAFAAMDKQIAEADRLLKSGDGTSNSGERPGFAGGDKNGTPGGAGGPKGPGIGKGKGPGQGTSPTGVVLNKYRKCEQRWHIRASYNGEEHLKKLQALKVKLVVPLRSKPGYALQFDLARPSPMAEQVKFSDNDQTVRWMNKNPQEMAALAQQLKLKEVPIFTVIYLPADLVERMARIEAEYSGRPDNEIEKTTWDVRVRDGVYDNEPYVFEQTYRGGK